MICSQAWITGDHDSIGHRAGPASIQLHYLAHVTSFHNSRKIWNAKALGFAPSLLLFARHFIGVRHSRTCLVDPQIEIAL